MRQVTSLSEQENEVHRTQAIRVNSGGQCPQSCLKTLLPWVPVPFLALYAGGSAHYFLEEPKALALGTAGK